MITDELSHIGKNKERTNNQGCPCPDRGYRVLNLKSNQEIEKKIQAII